MRLDSLRVLFVDFTCRVKFSDAVWNLLFTLLQEKDHSPSFGFCPGWLVLRLIVCRKDHSSRALLAKDSVITCPIFFVFEVFSRDLSRHVSSGNRHRRWQWFLGFRYRRWLLRQRYWEEVEAVQNVRVRDRRASICLRSASGWQSQYGEAVNYWPLYGRTWRSHLRFEEPFEIPVRERFLTHLRSHELSVGTEGLCWIPRWRQIHLGSLRCEQTRR